ncbi:HD-GYP domain-containing protein [Deefgea salmonis]|uniref:HD-GYP domain-containing protein n=1 Tax=Deefgea salmonis TaxID=2875502 RepID=A0ABS8BNV7_9NEIS|nr:HD-GYP domain-containing protein [Deefgea salmonis]MCB5197419.1 HD-GYP domain-containing protein [Deefgea salmonis]
MEIRIPIVKLQLGHFVSELDRPWLDTPFLMQGFLIESLQQIELLHDYCEHITLDLNRSVGGIAQWTSLLAPSTIHESSRHAQHSPLISAASREEQRKDKLNILRELRRLFSNWRQQSSNSADSHSKDPSLSTEIVIYDDTAAVEQEIKTASSSHQTAQRLVFSLMEAVRQDLQPRVEEINEVVSDLVGSIIRNPNALLWLTQLKDRDQYTYAHSIDSAVYLLAFGRHLGYPRAELQSLGMAGLMLDVGKMRLPPELLTRTGRYTPGEFMLMKTHVNHSLDILSQMEGIPIDVFDMVARHHERYDGSGYPLGLKAERIGMFASMAGIVDCFTALTSDRSYSNAKSAHEALQLMYKWSERYFHPALIEQFSQCVGIFHVGTLVELSTGEVGIVIGQNRVRRLKPKLLIILGPDKHPYAKPHSLDLITNPSLPSGLPINIRRELPRGAHQIDPREFFLD